MNLFDILLSAGLASILAGTIYIGRKLQVLEDLKGTTEKIKVNVKVIGDHLTKSDSEFNHAELQSYSPLKLTKVGKDLIESIGFDKIFAEHKDDFCQFIEGEEPKLKYDVELAATKSIAALAEEDYMESLKVFFYNNPTRNMQNTAPTLGVYIRDKYLQSHPEITK